MANLVAPHGGKGLTCCLLAGAELEAEKKRAEGLKTGTISPRVKGGLIMIGIGGFSPLTGFMTQADWKGVCDNFTMPSMNGLFWPIPITLSANKELADSIGDGSYDERLPGYDIVELDALAQLVAVGGLDVHCIADAHADQERRDDVARVGPGLVEQGLHGTGPEGRLHHREHRADQAGRERCQQLHRGQRGHAQQAQAIFVRVAAEDLQVLRDRRLDFRIAGRRAGDAPAVYSDPSKAEQELGWKARLGAEDMCRDAWNWQRKNPRGYV